MYEIRSCMCLDFVGFMIDYIYIYIGIWGQIFGIFFGVIYFFIKVIYIDFIWKYVNLFVVNFEVGCFWLLLIV